MEDTDAGMLERAKLGDEAAFLALYRRHRTPAFRFAYRLTASPVAAEDIVQDCFLTLLGRGAFDAKQGPPSPFPGTCNVSVTAVPSTTGVKLAVNGKAVWLVNQWSAGTPARLSLPGHGAYYLSWESRPKYRLAGYIEKNRLIFLMDGEYVEMTFAGKVLLAAESGPVWVFHDPGFVSRDVAELTAADREAVHAK